MITSKKELHVWKNAFLRGRDARDDAVAEEEGGPEAECGASPGPAAGA